jgi:hypothetical protein
MGDAERSRGELRGHPEAGHAPEGGRAQLTPTGGARAEAVLTAACSSRDLASENVAVIGDSMIRGLEKIFRHQRYISANWTFQVNEGEEALKNLRSPQKQNTTTQSGTKQHNSSISNNNNSSSNNSNHP